MYGVGRLQQRTTCVLIQPENVKSSLQLEDVHYYNFFLSECEKGCAGGLKLSYLWQLVAGFIIFKWALKMHKTASEYPKYTRSTLINKDW